MLVGSTLQDDIALTTRQLVAKGHDILGMVPGMNFERSAHGKTCPQSAAAPQGPSPVQLDRSPAGAGKLLRPVSRTKARLHEGNVYTGNEPGRIAYGEW